MIDFLSQTLDLPFIKCTYNLEQFKWEWEFVFRPFNFDESMFNKNNKGDQKILNLLKTKWELSDQLKNIETENRAKIIIKVHKSLDDFYLEVCFYDMFIAAKGLISQSFVLIPLVNIRTHLENLNQTKDQSAVSKFLEIIKKGSMYRLMIGQISSILDLENFRNKIQDFSETTFLFTKLVKFIIQNGILNNLKEFNEELKAVILQNKHFIQSTLEKAADEELEVDLMSLMQ